MDTNELTSREDVEKIYAPMWARGWPQSLSVDDGWLPLLARLGEQLREVAPTPRVQQIKEKFGGLRVYTNESTQEESDLIRAAEAEADRTCESCGQPGVLRVRRYWYSTRCADCAGSEFEVVDEE